MSSSTETRKSNIKFTVNAVDQEGRPIRQPDQHKLGDPSKTVVASEFAKSDTDSRYVDITDIPSGTLFYDWSRVSIRRMGVMDVRKAYHAQQTGSFRSFTQILGPTIDRDVGSLTLKDFWYFMYFHQNNSYPKATWHADFTCDNEEHLAEVRDGKKLEKTLHSKTQVRSRSLSTVVIDQERADRITAYIKKVQTDHGILLYPMTVADNIMWLEELEELEETKMVRDLHTRVRLLEQAGAQDIDVTPVLMQIDSIQRGMSDLEWMTEFAMHLHPTHGATVKERREFLEQQENPDILTCIEEFIELSDHGVIELVKGTCAGCSAEVEVPVSLSAERFLP